MRIVRNGTEARMLVEAFEGDDWKLAANLSPGMTWESHPDWYGPIRISIHDDAPVSERKTINIVTVAIPK